MQQFSQFNNIDPWYLVFGINYGSLNMDSTLAVNSRKCNRHECATAKTIYVPLQLQQAQQQQLSQLK